MHYKNNGKMEKGLQKQQPSLVSRILRAYVMMDITKFLFSQQLISCMTQNVLAYASYLRY